MTLAADVTQVAAQWGLADTPTVQQFQALFSEHFPEISRRLYERLPLQQRARFVAWMLKRWAKVDVVDPDERATYEEILAIADGTREVESLNGQQYLRRTYEYAGYDFSLLGYKWFTGVHDVYFDQYSTNTVSVRPGDVIIDGGAFIGDTAVLFDAKTGGQCEIHAFEILEENLVLMRHNLARNGVADRVKVVELALGSESGVNVEISTARLQASTSLLFPGDTSIPMITLDDYVERAGLAQVDFIKLDIEGSEVPALEGARRTIERFRPRLAICWYHK